MRGTPQQVAAEAERIVNLCRAPTEGWHRAKLGTERSLVPGGGYLFCTGEMNPRDTPVENMRAMIEAVRR